MENTLIQSRLRSLRSAMQAAGIDYYMIPTADFHSSEYVNDYFKVREYFCGFTGSAGTLLVWQDGAGLWTDGRYFIQAEREIAGTGVTLFRMLNDGVPTIEDFAADRIADGQTLGFDGRTINAREGLKLEELFKKKQKNVTIAYDRDLAETIWTDRSAYPAGDITILDESVAGKSVEDKLSEVRERLAEKEADELLLTKLDDIMWLFNIRGCDVECNPVAMSYAYITQSEATLFLQKKVLNDTLNTYFAQHGIIVEEYAQITEFLEKLSADRKILTDNRYCSYTLYKTLAGRQTLTDGANPTELLKAVKNPVELANMERIFLKDNVALTKFIYWLKTNIGKPGVTITELTASDKLEQFRREIPEFLDLSFTTIAGYEANAAMMHYEATPENAATLRPRGLFLVDSGGQYVGGTTDVTRTIALGPVSDIEKYHYTLVAASMLQLTHARWLYGCSGCSLDILAREPIWSVDLDYQCGTGHGVGYILNVHEGPQSMRWRTVSGNLGTSFEAGMDITNEPGIYIEGSHGIRIENVMVARNGVKNAYGQFMYFDTLTWVPLDPDAIDPEKFTGEQLRMYNEYQQEVYRRLSPYLTAAERDWLERETRAISQ